MISFDPVVHANSTSIVLVGLGGTGSVLARHVARTVYHMRQLGLQLPRSIHFVDPDVIEEKNVGRQMFTVADVGKYKAETLARRFNVALGLNIRYHNTCYDCRTFERNSCIVIGAVDNHEARAAIAKTSHMLWIDSGNHYNAGQVIIGNTDSLPMVRRDMEVDENDEAEREHWRWLPYATTLYPELLQPDPDEPVANLSCADLVEQGSQHLLINELMAGIAAQYLYKVLFRQEIYSFMTFVDGDALNVRSVPIRNLGGYLGSE